MIKKISIIIPCRNEVKYIDDCLYSLRKQDIDIPLEILVIDGMSEDGTREVIKKFNGVKIVDNPKKYTPFALNLGIKKSTGDVIIRLDSHARYPINYVSKCIENLIKYKADNVGGMTIPMGKNKAILQCLQSPFGAGSDFRMGGRVAKETDTVFCGCYPKETFEKFGLFNECLVRSQDIEFNIRIKKMGGKIMYCPDIVAYYYPKDTLWCFLKHNIKDGEWAIYPLKFGVKLKLRHYIPLLLILTLPISIIPYLILNLWFTIKGKNLILFPTFICRHFGYGIGSLIGVIKLCRK